MSKISKKKVSVEKRKTKNKKIALNIIFAKIFIILIVVYGFYYTQKSFENNISLLAVTEDQNGAPVTGSIVKLNLKIKPGTGQIYTNLNTIEEVDTQISIINSQKIACELFMLDCENYDFFYSFEGSALILKGPSASSAIAILVTKTLMNEKIDNKVVITGSLNSGGIIGNVGGIEQKIDAAQDLGLKKVLIPIYSKYNKTKTREIEVIEVIDIIDAYNNFNSNEKYELKVEQYNSTKYAEVMKIVGEDMCKRTDELKNEINFDLIEINSSLDKYRENAQKSYNYSKTAYSNQNYYSQGSFCYNSNINYRIIIEKQKNLSNDKVELNINDLKKDIRLKYIEYNSENYREDIQTINDFYIYLLMLDRIEEAREFLDEANKNELKELNDILIENIEITNSSNQTKINISDIINGNQNSKDKKELYYSYAIERYYTVGLWEKLIKHDGEKIILNQDKINEACIKINKEISIKSQLLSNYGLTFFNKDINEQLEYSSPVKNKYVCIYKGLELNGKVNTVLNSVGINDENQYNYTKQIIEITNSRINLNSNGDFPLIPYIYHEYSKELLESKDYSSSMLYSNYALSYIDLNLYLEKEKQLKPYFNRVINEIYNGNYLSILFIGGLLVILGFL